MVVRPVVGDDYCPFREPFGWAAFSGSLETVTLFVPGVVVARADLKTKTETVTIQSDRVAIRSPEQSTQEAGYPTNVSSLAKVSP